MFFKELFAWYILFSYQCSFVLLITRSRQLCYNIMCCFLCQQLFSTFFDFVFALSTKALKTHQCFVDLLLPCSTTLVNIHLGLTKVNNIFKNISKKAFWLIRTIHTSVFVHFVYFFYSSLRKRAVTMWQLFLFLK